MANDKAFNAMNNAAGNDMYATGGAISMSEYEQNMDPTDQKKYEDILMGLFETAYMRDPYKQNLDFKHWLKTLNPDLYRERAQKWEEIVSENNGTYKLAGMEPIQAGLLEDAGRLQRLAHLHTGLIEDLVGIVEVKSIDKVSPPPQSAVPQGGAMGQQDLTSLAPTEEALTPAELEFRK